MIKREGDPNELIEYMKKKSSGKGYNLKIVNYGIASRFGKDIVMNKHLAKYKSFCLDVLDHEIRHSEKLSKKDMLMDTTEGSILTNLEFCFRHPSGFVQFLPIGIYNKKIFFDLNLIGVYLIAAIMLIIFFWVF